MQIDLDELERLAKMLRDEKSYLMRRELQEMMHALLDANTVLELIRMVRERDADKFFADAPDHRDERINELEAICAEAYQVVGVLAEEAGRFDDPQSVKAMDNLSQQKMVHDDVLPFPAKGE